ncbi:MAG: bifunctional (p)ppGpp synthetase/guanosine-3',5'-bis(diphosphate) 3'-pyrophosphohydrolase [Saprospiraceae bacterium]|nr:bifunctional (p)ppGpp synthetase/guanosine-3',5'-bis(diphosphate) 3'-pyrophosphohydrolase [Saprospiraceae bacterium]MBP7699294.1 bifunctional (p)ppGpp synthetase/guanosine-3',5'-bis(diphosphate) 3'-pyrophosphohydrolase [Saprospiraceae bacterium]
MQEVLIKPEEELHMVQAAYEAMLASIKSRLSENDRKMIQRAFEVAEEGHRPQRRKTGEPYILHPIEVARICAEEIRMDAVAVTCALLHDVVEDTAFSLDFIRTEFGDKIAVMVDGLTKLDRSYNSESPQAENFKKVLSTLLVDTRIVMIKMADRLHNMRTLGAMPVHKQLKIAAETSYIYAPLAHKLGLYALKTEFQDLCMKITDPENYHEIARKLQGTKRLREKYIEEFIAPLRSMLAETFGAEKYKVFGRPKSINSIYNKVKTKHVPFEEIYDLFAVRIIIDVPHVENEKRYHQLEHTACLNAYAIVTGEYPPIPERFKDWVVIPKSNGYRSLHTTVVGPKGRYVEVQIRSESMDAVAERGLAAHWKYKGIDAQDTYDNLLEKVREALSNPNVDAVEFVTEMKTNLFDEEIYVMTPKGDMRILPQGATALDFAFDIHTDIGSRCSAVKVNNKLEGMGYVLHNGDQIEIITNKNQKPTESWLKLVITTKAKSKIKTALREESKKQSEFGKEALERKLKNMHLDFESNVDTLVKLFGLRTRIDFYFAITNGNIDLSVDLKKLVVEHGKFKEVETDNASNRSSNGSTEESIESKRFGKPKLMINDQIADELEYSLATCCNPVQGDDVFAFINSNAGMKIHRTNCQNATNLMANYGYRVLKAEWRYSATSSFAADLKITGIDEGPGVIERLTNTISSSLGLNIRSFNIEGREGYFEGRVSLIVQNKDQLTLAIRAIKNLPGVRSVVRLDN